MRMEEKHEKGISFCTDSVNDTSAGVNRLRGDINQYGNRIHSIGGSFHSDIYSGIHRRINGSFYCGYRKIDFNYGRKWQSG